MIRVCRSTDIAADGDIWLWEWFKDGSNVVDRLGSKKHEISRKKQCVRRPSVHRQRQEIDDFREFRNMDRE